MEIFKQGKDVHIIPKYTRHLLPKFNGSLSSSKNTGFVTLQGPDTDGFPSPALVTPKSSVSEGQQRLKVTSQVPL
jgi:hypothetical protein